MSKSLRTQVIEMTTDKVRPEIDNVYRESLRSILDMFGGLHYIDGNGKKIKVKCVYGNPERIAGKLKADNTLILPMITIVETETLNDDLRRRYTPVLLNEKYWDEKELREDRILQKAIDISLETYVENPKFLITNTGEIKEFNV